MCLYWQSLARIVSWRAPARFISTFLPNVISITFSPDTSNALPTLGRVLFYDRNLSVSSTIACASCHKQSYGFADNQAFSQGFGGRVTTRNSMPVQNLQGGNIMFFDDRNTGGFAPQQGHLFWDGSRIRPRKTCVATDRQSHRNGSCRWRIAHEKTHGKNHIICPSSSTHSDLQR
ncbi:MAG: cytochrome-c peroxidase [Bacteroidota bacterium]